MVWFFGDPEVLDVLEQPPHVEYRTPDSANILRHTFDLLVTLRSGTRIFVQVKPAELASTLAFQNLMKRIASQVPKRRADSVMIFTDRCPDPVEVDNRAFLVSVRRDPPTDLDARVAQLVSSLSGSVPIAWIVDTIGDGAAFRAAARLIDAGVLAPATSGRITPDLPVKFVNTVNG